MFATCELSRPEHYIIINTLRSESVMMTLNVTAARYKYTLSLHWLSLINEFQQNAQQIQSLHCCHVHTSLNTMISTQQMRRWPALCKFTFIYIVHLLSYRKCWSTVISFWYNINKVKQLPNLLKRKLHFQSFTCFSTLNKLTYEIVKHIYNIGINGHY